MDGIPLMVIMFEGVALYPMMMGTAVSAGKNFDKPDDKQDSTHRFQQHQGKFRASTNCQGSINQQKNNPKFDEFLSHRRVMMTWH
jgi:hypothetical protein